MDQVTPDSSLKDQDDVYSEEGASQIDIAFNEVPKTYDPCDRNDSVDWIDEPGHAAITKHKNLYAKINSGVPDSIKAIKNISTKLHGLIPSELKLPDYISSR